MTVKDVQALHRLLDAVIDKIEEVGDDAYVAMDLSSCAVGVRMTAEPGQCDWAMYRDCYGSEYCRANVLDDVIAELKAVEVEPSTAEAMPETMTINECNT